MLSSAMRVVTSTSKPHLQKSDQLMKKTKGENPTAHRNHVNAENRGQKPFAPAVGHHLRVRLSLQSLPPQRYELRFLPPRSRLLRRPLDRMRQPVGHQPNQFSSNGVNDHQRNDEPFKTGTGRRIEIVGLKQGKNRTRSEYKPRFVGFHRRQQRKKQHCQKITSAMPLVIALRASSVRLETNSPAANDRNKVIRSTSAS